MRSWFLSTHCLKPSGTSVTWFSLPSNGSKPRMMRFSSSAISFSVFRMVVVKHRQWGCQPVNLKSLGYSPFNSSQMSINGPFTPLHVWFCDRCTSMPTMKSMRWYLSKSADRYAMLVSVAASRRAFMYDDRYTPWPGWNCLAACESFNMPCSSLTLRKSLSGCFMYERMSRAISSADLPSRIPTSRAISNSFLNCPVYFHTRIERVMPLTIRMTNASLAASLCAKYWRCFFLVSFAAAAPSTVLANMSFFVLASVHELFTPFSTVALIRLFMSAISWFMRAWVRGKRSKVNISSDSSPTVAPMAAASMAAAS